jgi:hypothetical protein
VQQGLQAISVTIAETIGYIPFVCKVGLALEIADSKGKYP